MIDEMSMVVVYIVVFSLPYELLTAAQPEYAIKKLKPYSVNYEDYCDLTFPVNASFVPKSMWFKKTKDGGRNKLDIDRYSQYHVICEECNKFSQCEYDHWRFCYFKFILRITMQEGDRIGQYVAQVGDGSTFVEHTFTLTRDDLQVYTTTIQTTVRSNGQGIILTKQHMYIGIGVAAGVVFMFMIVFVALCYIGRKRRSENNRRRHHRTREREPSIISNFVSNHTYADISGVYDGLNPNTQVNNRSSYTIPKKNKKQENIGGASNFLQQDYNRKHSNISVDDNSYLEPEPLAYQLTGTNHLFPSSPTYDDSAFKKKVNQPPVLPLKTRNTPQDTQYINVNPVKTANNKIYKR